MPDLTEFLLARITEDEAIAIAATPGPWTAQGGGQIMPPPPWTRQPWETNSIADCQYGGIAVNRADSKHIARWDPARVLAESEAKRRIVQVAMFTGPKEFTDTMAGVLQLLAQPYSDHPDFDKSWRVE